MPALEDPSPEPATAYSPDDPAYGPPSPEWYAGETQSGQPTAEQVAARGVFEPPPNQGDPAHEPPAGQPLEQIKAFYLTAEAISPENLDRRFDELLERQRKLISEYFSEAALQESPR